MKSAKQSLKASIMAVLTAASFAAQSTEGLLTADSYTVKTPTNTLYNGKAADLSIGGAAKALVRFDLATLPSGTTATNVLRATAIVWVNRVTKAGAIEVAPVTSSWNETTASSKAEPIAGNTLATVPVSASGYAMVDVTAAVKNWLTTPSNNLGLRIAAAGTSPLTSIAIDSKENTTASRPARLDITLAQVGPTGQQGPIGPAGAQGIPGEKGEQGDKGETGADGPQGPIGPIGLTGAQGSKGDAGSNGKSCTDVQVGDPCTPGNSDLIGIGKIVEVVINGTTFLKCSSPARFIDQGDTILDTSTGLEWEKKTDFQIPDIHDKDNRYNWSTGVPWIFNGTAETGFLTTLNRDFFAGHNDWRLPSLNELTSILSGVSNPRIDPIFGPTAAEFYWTSSTVIADRDDYAWGVNFSNSHPWGDSYGEYKDSGSFPVRAVRYGR